MKNLLALIALLACLPVSAQRTYYSVRQFNVPVGGSIHDTVVGLVVRGNLISPNIVRVDKPTVSDQTPGFYEKNVFKLDLTIYNAGKYDVLITDWNFTVCCSENNMGLVWQEYSFINLVTAYVPNGTIVVLKPGDQKRFDTGETDFYWCMPQHESALLENPRFFTAKILCANDTSQPSAILPPPLPPYTPSLPPVIPPAYQPPVASTTDPIDPELLSMIEEYKAAYTGDNVAEAAELKKTILDIANQAYPDRLDEINELIDVSKLRKYNNPKISSSLGIFAGNQGNTADDGTGYSNWLFVQSDKAVQQRFKLVKTAGDIGYYRVQFRINFDDQIFCTSTKCLGYIFCFGYPDLQNRDNIYAHFKIYNTYKQVYTLPELMAIKLAFADGSKRFLEQDGFHYADSKGSGHANFFYSCADIIMSNSTELRCGWRDIFVESKAITLK